MGRDPGAVGNKAQFCSLRIILDETVVLEGNREYFVRGAVDCEEFKAYSGIFTGYKDKLASMDVLSANSLVSLDKGGKILVRLYFGHDIDHFVVCPIS